MFAGTLYWMLRREKRRDRLGLNDKEGEKRAFDDLTDGEILWSRYGY
jgi:hypothetical protein